MFIQNRANIEKKNRRLVDFIGVELNLNTDDSDDSE